MAHNSNISDELDSSSTKNLIKTSDCDTYHHREKFCQYFSCTRFYICVLSLLACIMLYITRVNLSVTIVAMVNDTSIDSETNQNRLNATIGSQCYASESSGSAVNKVNGMFSLNTLHTFSTKKPNSGEFLWSQSTQGIILGAFDSGYIWFQVIGGRMAEIYGSKWICGIAMLMSALINIATPFIARLNLYLFIGSRVILGLCQSAVFPSLYALFNKWIPDNERSTVLPWLDAGCVIGTIIAMSASGALSSLQILDGWPTVFYLSGIVVIVWLIPWLAFVTSDPADHPWISEKELNFIKDNTRKSSADEKSSLVPWCEILKSKEFLSVAFVKFMNNCSSTFLLLKLPSYLHFVINMSIDKIGFFISLIFIGISLTLMFGGYVSNLIINKFTLSKTTVRKLFEAISGFSLAIIFVIISLIGCNKIVIIILLITAGLMSGLTSGGDIPIVADMTDRYPATVYAIMNAFTTVNGFITPYVIGLIIDPNPTSLTLWSYCFYFAAFSSTFGTLIFILFASAQHQNWN